MNNPRGPSPSLLDRPSVPKEANAQRNQPRARPRPVNAGSEQSLLNESINNRRSIPLTSIPRKSTTMFRSTVEWMVWILAIAVVFRNLDRSGR